MKATAKHTPPTLADLRELLEGARERLLEDALEAKRPKLERLMNFAGVLALEWSLKNLEGA